MSKENYITEIMSEYLRNCEIIYLPKVTLELKPHVPGWAHIYVQESNTTIPGIPHYSEVQGGFCLSLSFTKITQDIRRD